VINGSREAHENVFRTANEAIQRHRLSPERTLLVFLCECTDLACQSDIELTLEEYATVRSGGLRFAVAMGHEDEAEERVVDEFERYTVVEK
jgi:hypothetical protein